jgi:electron transfer flavoprotein alpha subunit
MANILVHIELSGDRISQASLRILGLGRQLASELGATLGAVLPCPAAPSYGEDDHVALLSRYGADKVVLVVDPRFSGPCTFPTHGAALLAACQRYPPALMLLAATPAGRELGPRLALELGSAYLPDVARAHFSRGELEFSQSIHGGRLVRRSDAARTPAVATCLPWNELLAVGDDEAEVIMVPAAEADTRFQLESLTPQSGGLDPSFVRVLVAGGAGVGPAGFEKLESLARALGGALVGTESACAQGLLPKERSIGLTGRRVAPQLYLCFGASGSADHLRTLRGDPVIVAINTDRRAPIMKVARYALVADATEIATHMLEALANGHISPGDPFDGSGVTATAVTEVDGTLPHPGAPGSFGMAGDLETLETLDGGPAATGEEPSS